MKRILCVCLILLVMILSLASCDNGKIPELTITVSDDGYLMVNGIKTEHKVDKEDVITVEDGYVVVNGVKTEHKVDTQDDTNIPTEKPDTIEVVDGYLVVNGTKTEHKVHTEPVISIIDGYVAVNGVKTEHKVHTEPVITEIDGCVAINGIKTEYKIDKGDVVTIENGYLVVNGTKTEHKIHTEPVVSVIDGYVAVNGVKTEHKVHTEPVISVIDGYVAVNGVKTDYLIATSCNHIWNTVTTTPTCTAGGYDTMTCPLCDKSVKVNETNPIAHTYETTYSIDDDYHWFKCTGCDDAKDKALHTLDDDGVCTVCDKPVSATPGIIYDISADGTYAEVIGYEGTATKVKIAEEYKGLPVNRIYDNAFEDNQNITHIVIPDNVQSIGNSAFYYCNQLVYVDLGNGLKDIGPHAFSGCSSLTSIVIPNGVKKLEFMVFGYCTKLTSIILPNELTSINGQAFGYRNATMVIQYNEYGNCKYLGTESNPYFALIMVSNTSYTSYTIHKDTQIIADEAFADCGRFSSIVIPKSVIAIGTDAFLENPKLTDVYYTGSEDDWTQINIDKKTNGRNEPLINSTIHYNYVPEE